jgi:hypothetical protein
MRIQIGNTRRSGMVGALLSMILMLTGCTTHMDFNYTPLASVDTLCTADAPPKVMVVKFADERSKKEVGGVRNAFGMTVSGFDLKEDDLTRSFTSAVADTLRKAGYKVAMNSERAMSQEIPAGELEKYDYLVGGKISVVRVYTQPGLINVNAKAEVAIDVCIRKLKGTPREEWTGLIKGDSLKQNYAMMTDVSGTAAGSLNMAMQDCMIKLVNYLKTAGLLPSS